MIWYAPGLFNIYIYTYFLLLELDVWGAEILLAQAVSMFVHSVDSYSLECVIQSPALGENNRKSTCPQVQALPCNTTQPTMKPELLPSSFCFLCLFLNQFRACRENGDYYNSSTPILEALLLTMIPKHLSLLFFHMVS